jgi:hypothetical protein
LCGGASRFCVFSFSAVSSIGVVCFWVVRVFLGGSCSGLDTMEEVVEQVDQEVASSPIKRARSESSVVVAGGDYYAVQGQETELEDFVVAAPPRKKLCIEDATDLPAIISNVLELEDLELRGSDENSNSNSCSAGHENSCVLNSSEEEVGSYAAAGGQTSAALLPEHAVVIQSLFREEQQQSECLPLDKESDAARVLRSLEEELGVSSDSDDDYASSISSCMPTSAVQDQALVDAALSSWGEEIWNSTSVSNAAGDDVVSVLAGTTFEAHQVQDGLSAQVDIGFLNEASDDELGIPPSPNSQRVFADEDVREICEENMSKLSDQARTEHSAAAVGDGLCTEPVPAEATHLHEAVSWALHETSAESTGFEADPDWLNMPVGSLDFLLDFSTGSYVPVAT